MTETPIVQVNEGQADKGARGSWGSQLEFILTCVGYAVGLGNVWRFPYLCFKNGGGAFLVPYFICLLVLGIPFFYMEVCLGQYSSLGPIKMWRLNPWFKGLGISMITITGVITIYYAVIIAYCVYFFFGSMQAVVPWKTCNTSWSTCYCRDGNQNDTLLDPWNGTRNECRNFTYIDNSTVSPSSEYFNNQVLQLTAGIDDLQELKWDVTLCNVLVWFITFMVLSKGIKSLGKVVYFTALFPYILLTALLIRGLTLEGHMDGIRFYLTADFEKLTKAEVWSDAAVQTFYSTSACLGGLIAMSSYNQFNNNVLRDAFMIPIIDLLTSFYAGLVTFCVLGFMAYQKNTTVEKVIAGGPGLAFIVFPEALAQMPISPLWSVLFFMMMMMLGFSTIFSLVETVITGIYDQFEDFMKQNKKRLYLFRTFVCCLFFVLGLPLTTRGGLFVLNLVDSYVGGIPLLIVGITELVVVIYIYGAGYETKDTEKCPWYVMRGLFHFKSNIELMMGKSKLTTVTFYYFGISWCLVAPIILILVVILKGYQYRPITLGSYTYPDWANAVGWIIAMICLLPIVVWWLYYFITKDISRGCRPKNSWGPSELPKPEWSIFFFHPFKQSKSSYSLIEMNNMIQDSTTQRKGSSDSLQVPNDPPRSRSASITLEIQEA